MFRQVDRRHWWWGALTVPLVLLAGCTSPGSPGATRLQIDLKTDHVVAGHEITGVLVIFNPNASFDLTKLVKGHCQPGFAVILEKGSFRNSMDFTEECAGAPFVISGGVTRLSFHHDHDVQRVWTGRFVCQQHPPVPVLGGLPAPATRFLRCHHRVVHQRALAEAGASSGHPELRTSGTLSAADRPLRRGDALPLHESQALDLLLPPDGSPEPGRLSARLDDDRL